MGVRPASFCGYHTDGAGHGVPLFTSTLKSLRAHTLLIWQLTHAFYAALAMKKGYRLNRGRGAPDVHRAGLEVLRDAVDGVVCLAFLPPASSD